MKFSNNFLMSTIIITPLLAISSNSWIFLWILLEIGSMAFIMMMIYKSNNTSKESAMKYFLIQSSASCLLLMGFLTKESNIMVMKMTLMIPSVLILMAISIKMAAAPFHFWLPPMAIKISWNNLAIMLTWVKMAPLMILMKNNPWLTIFFVSITSMTMGTISQFNMTSTKMIMTLSSISHLGWIMMASLINQNLPLGYLMIYSSISISIMMNFKMKNMKSLIQQMTKKMKWSMTLLILSLAGIPPLMGFIPKWMVLSNVQQNIKSILILSSMVILASISFFIYIRMVMSPMLNQTPNSNLSINKMEKSKMINYMNMLLPVLIIFYPK